MSERTKVDEALGKIKNHPILSILIVLAIAIIAVGAFTDALTKVTGFLGAIFSHSTPSTTNTLIDPAVHARIPAPATINGRISDLSPTSPLPKGFEQVPPGTRLSLVRGLFPGGNSEYGIYTLYELDSPTFRSASFKISSTKDAHDPPVDFVMFFFHDEAAKAHFWTSAIAALAPFPSSTEVLGDRIRWRNVQGFEVVLEKTFYSVSRIE